jgi:outer membrane protein
MTLKMAGYRLNVAILAAIASVSNDALAKDSEWSFGVAASYSPAVYSDTPSNRTVIPVIGYEGEHLFLRGFGIGYRVFPKGATQNFVLRARYDPRTLKPEDSTDADMQKLDERKASVLGGVSYQLLSAVGMFEVTAGTDIGSTHNGLYAEAAWRVPIRRGPWGVTPSIGYSYNSERLNNHLYGVSQQEASRTNFELFDAGWNGQYFVGLSGYAYLTSHIRLVGGVRYTNLDGDIAKSPIIQRGVYTSANIGVAYVF